MGRPYCRFTNGSGGPSHGWVGADMCGLRATIRTHMQIVAENIETATVYLHEWKFLSSSSKSLVEKKRDRYEALIREVIVEGVEQGEFRPIDVKFATLMILSALNWTYQWYSSKGALTAEEIADQYLNMFLHGVSAT